MELTVSQSEFNFRISKVANLNVLRRIKSAEVYKLFCKRKIRFVGAFVLNNDTNCLKWTSVRISSVSLFVRQVVHYWLLLCAGAPGTDGETGQQGATGSRGATGSTGLAGAAGWTGGTGLPGLVGAAGEPGQAGVQGVAGATGVIGMTGPAGLPGTLCQSHCSLLCLSALSIFFAYVHETALNAVKFT